MNPRFQMGCSVPCCRAATILPLKQPKSRLREHSLSEVTTLVSGKASFVHIQNLDSPLFLVQSHSPQCSEAFSPLSAPALPYKHWSSPPRAQHRPWHRVDTQWILLILIAFFPCR